jgi:hypothetical protein
LLAAGCGNAQKETTEAAIHAAQTAITAVETDAAKYVPDQLQSAEKAMQNANDALAKGDYAQALSAAQDAAGKAKDLATSAAVQRAEWTRQWKDASASIPKSLDEVKNKLDAYSHGAPMPAGVDRAKLADAKKQYEQVKQTWSDASLAATQGDLGESMKKMAGIKDALEKLMEILGTKR